MAQIVFTLIVLIFNFPGLVVYRVLRPPLTLQEAEEHRLESTALTRELQQTPPCPRCGCEILADYLACPRCALPLRMSCTTCERVLDPSWQICPWCVTPAKNDQTPASNGGGRPPQTQSPSPAGQPTATGSIDD